MKTPPQDKLFTLGAVSSVIVGSIIYSLLIYGYKTVHNSLILEDYIPYADKLFWLIPLSSVYSFFYVYRQSQNFYSDNHLARAILFAIGNINGALFFTAEINARSVKQIKNSTIYGLIALLAFVIMLIAIFWYSKTYLK